MPLFGTLDVDAALADAPTVDSLAPEPWSLPGAEVLQVSYEVREDPALAITPPALHPSIPPYTTFSFMRFPESPAGPFNLAMIRLIVRAGIRPRGLLLQGFIDNDDAAARLASGWGYRLRTATVGVSRRHDRIAGTVSINGVTALEASLTDPEPVIPTDLELFDNLHLTNVADDDPVIMQVDPGYHYSSADRGQAGIGSYEPTLLGVAGLEPTFRLVAVSCSADIDLAAPRFVMDPKLPAFQGTRRLQTS